MSDLRCTRCGRTGTRDFQAERSPGSGSPFLVCTNETACRQRKANRNREDARMGSALRRAQKEPSLGIGPLRPRGTAFITAKLSPCPLCAGTIYPDMIAIQTSWTKPDIALQVRRGTDGAVHRHCAVRYGITIDLTDERIHADLRRIFSEVPPPLRRFRKKAA